MKTPITSIYIPPTGPDGRLREDKGDLTELMDLLTAHGQLMPVLVKRITREIEGRFFEFELVDGERRLSALNNLSAQALVNPELKEQLARKGVESFQVDIKTLDTMTALEQRLIEDAANRGRKDFDWREKAKTVKIVHEGYMALHNDWTIAKTGAVLCMSVPHVYKFLGLIEDQEVFNSPAVQNAQTFNTAVKQTEIKKDIKRRVLIAKHTEAIATASPEAGPDYNGLARQCIRNMDAREWIKTVPDNSLAWAHWDPPYGTREGSGGAFSNHEAVNMDPEYCFQLMREMIPEIYRVLKPGSWFVMWYSHIYYEPIKRMLQGHVFPEMGPCVYCGKHSTHLDMFEGHYKCKKSPHAFWTNPFPNYWLKTGIGNDGHEIKRFLKKDTEPFLMACKSDNPILPFTSRGNVFIHDVPTGTERQHVNQKPRGLLSEILEVISVGGEVGCDPGVGSGTIIEAAFGKGRKVIGCDIAEQNWATSVGITVQELKKQNIRSLSFAPWLNSHSDK